jgi:hypothetical protein
MNQRQQAVILRKHLEAKLQKKPTVTRREIEQVVRCQIIGDYCSLFTTKVYLDKGREYCRLLEVINENPKGIMDEVIRYNISANMSIEELKVYFTPGNKVMSYSGSVDMVLSFRQGNGGWFVDVISQQPIDSLCNHRVRRHCTMPSYGDLYKHKELNGGHE